MINAAKAGIDCDLVVLIAICRHAKSKISTKYLRGLLQKEGIYEEVEFIEDFIAPLGRATDLDEELLVEDTCLSLVESQKLPIGCPEIGTAPSIHPNGELLVCCGHAAPLKPEILTLEI